MINDSLAFRGKSEETGAWVCGYLYVLAKGSSYEEYYILGHLDHRESVHDLWKCATKVIPDTVGQYAGLEDKNHKRIFGGDIVRHILHNGLKEVTYYNGRWLPFNAYPEYKCWFSKNCEIVGNIWDNPELLQGGLRTDVTIVDELSKWKRELNAK